MIIKVGINEISVVEQDFLNAGEYNIHECNFIFDEVYDGLVKKAVFSNKTHSYQVSILDDECTIPYEVLQEKSVITIGVYAYEVQNEELIMRYSPKPCTKYIDIGSYKEHYDNYEELTPTDKEQMEQMLENINITASKVEDTTTISITNSNGVTHEVEILDGEKGEKGDPGSVTIIVVNVLPTEDIDESAIYLVPNPDTEEQNRYVEYIYINGIWEKLGETQIEVDLSDYYTKEQVNNLIPTQLSQLTDDSTHRVVTDAEKTTWNNKYTKASTGIPKTDLDSSVQTSLGKADTAIQEHQDITGKEDKSNKVTSISSQSTNTQYPSALAVYNYVDGIVGDINTLLDTLNRTEV